jgi:hypothetical protein
MRFLSFAHQWLLQRETFIVPVNLSRPNYSPATVGSHEVLG